MAAPYRPTLIGYLGWSLLVLPASPGRAAEPAASVSSRVLLVSNRGSAAPAILTVSELKADLPAGVYKLEPKDGAPAITAEVFSRQGRTFIAFAPNPGARDGSAAYTISSSGTAKLPEAIDPSSRNAPELKINSAGKPFVTYVASFAPKPYYFPVIGPTGTPFTRAFPMEKVDGEDKDHFHQRSMWFTHGLVNGIDFWAADPLNKPKPNYGSIKETAREVLANGTYVAAVRTTDDWLGNEGKKVCEDERIVSFYTLGDARVIDFDITLKATNGPVTFGDTKEGMFGLRVASSMDVKKENKGSKITNAEGVTDAATWGKASPWVDYVGPVAGKMVGIAILNHPESFRYPTTWHVRPYGLFAANPFGWKDFGQKRSGEHTVPAGESIRFRYRVILHAGDSADVRGAFQAYAEPPRVELQ